MMDPQTGFTAGAVEEVERIVEDLFSSVLTRQLPNCEQVTSLEQSLEIAFGSPDNPSFSGLGMMPNFLTHTKEDILAEYYSLVPYSSSEQNFARINSMRKIGMQLDKKFAGSPHVEIVEPIWTDMEIILYHLTNREGPILGSQLYQTYSAGCWPCGWSGRYPAGRLIVYYPVRSSFSA